MRKIKVESRGDKVHVYVGDVDANGNYEFLELSQAEAAVLMMELQRSL